MKEQSSILTPNNKIIGVKKSEKKDCETLLVKQKEEMKKIMSQHDLTMIDYGRLENIEEEKQKYDDS